MEKEYSSFLTEKDGLYISVMPTAESVKNLSYLFTTIKNIGLEYTGMVNLHVTVIFSATTTKDLDKLYKQAKIDPAKTFEAKVKKFDYWEGHKNQGVLVLLLDCPELETAHYNLREKGYSVTYPDYKPHMTIIDDLHTQGYNGKKAKNLAAILNAQVLGSHRTIQLTGMKAEAAN